MVAKVYEASSPSAEVDSFTIVERNGAGVITPGAGHQVPVSVSFNGLDTVTHIVRLFTASAALLHEYDVQPTVDVVTVFDPIYFRVGDGGADTPAADQPDLVNSAFVGLAAEELSVSQEGLGFLHPGDDYTLYDDTLSLEGTVFETDQRWRIFKNPVVITNTVNDSVVGKGFGGFVDVVANIDYSASHLRKLIRLSGTGNYTFPLAADIPIGYTHHFVAFGTEGSSPQINFSNGTLLWGATPKSFLVVPFGSTCAFTWDGTNWNCILNDIKTGTVAPASGDVISQGSYHIGDVSAGAVDTFATITHGLALAYSYKVLATLRGTTASVLNDNNVGWVIYDLQPSYFKVALQEFRTGVQDITLDWVIIKT